MTDLRTRPPSTGAPPSERLALWVFVAYLVAAVPILLWLGSYRWFYGDEWAFIADRSIAVDDLFRDHNSHWSTIPVLIYRGLYSAFGLHSYAPYQLVVILLHLSTAALLRVAMRRADVGPWIATAAAGAYVLLGPAEDNILWGFQIGFAGTLALGLAHVMLADHDGPIDRRDWYGLGVGFVALLMSGQAPPLVMAAGVVCLLHRRWQAAAFHTVPLGVVYLAWLALADVEPVYRVDGRPFTIGEYVEWMGDAVRGLFMGVGYFAPIALALAAVLVVGAVVAWRSEREALLRRAAVPVALLLAAFVSISVAAPSRFFLGEDQARASRYVGVLVALTLPALAVAADAVARRWRAGLPVVLVLLLVPVPFNIAAFGEDELISEEFFDRLRTSTTALAEHPLASAVPPWVRPNDSIVGQPDMTIGWLLQATENGEIPESSRELDPFAATAVPLQLGVAVVDEEPDTEGMRCGAFDEQLAIDPAVGDRLTFDSPVRVAGRRGDQPATIWRAYAPSTVEITLPDLQLLLAPPEGESEFELCR